MSKQPLNPLLFMVIIVVTDVLFLAALGWWGVTLQTTMHPQATNSSAPVSKIPNIDVQGLNKAVQ